MRINQVHKQVLAVKKTFSGYFFFYVMMQIMFESQGKNNLEVQP